MMMLGRDKIATMIPHDGNMCLLDGVVDWGPDFIRCISYRYRETKNPLRRTDGTLGAACGIEIAAQAMAVHGRLNAAADARPSRGFLASVRDVRLVATHLDTKADAIEINAELLMGDSGGATYKFALEQNGIEVLSGRATVVLDVDA